MFKRYHIEVKEAPHAFKKPNKFSVKVHKAKFVPMIINDLSKAKNPSELSQTIKSRPCIYGVYGSVVGGMAPIEDKCRGCFRCVIENPGVVDVTINPEFKNAGDSYFRPNLVATIWEEASNGKVPVKGAGYGGPFAGPGFDGMWTDFSEIVRPTRDGIHGREFISTEVDIGRKSTVFSGRANDIVSIQMPIIFDAPSGIDAKVIKEAAKKTGTLAIVALRDLKRLEENVVPRASIGEIGKIDNGYKIIEVEVDSVEGYKEAKAALPGKIVIARIIASGNDAFIADVAKHADSIHLVHDFHGFELSKNPRFIIDSTIAAHEALVEAKIRDELSLIVGGGIAAAEHVPKTIICGADIVSIDIAALVALQCKFRGQATQSLPSLNKFRTEWGTQRLVNLLASWHDQLLEISGAMGMREIRRMRGELGRAMFYEDLEVEVFEPIFGKRKTAEKLVAK